MPTVDDITKNTVIFIVNNYPQIAERYGDFLATLNINFDENVPDINMDEKAAEKYIVSLKLQKWLETLHIQKKELTAKLLNGEDVSDKIDDINKKIIDAQSRIDTLISI